MAYYALLNFVAAVVVAVVVAVAAATVCVGLLRQRRHRRSTGRLPAKEGT